MENKTIHKPTETLKFEKLNYNSYLKIPELLSLQQELSAPAHHDEMFFIVIHQAAELWFKEMLHETQALIESFKTNSISRSLKVLRRLSAVMGLQVQQIGLLSTLTPVEFAGFRDHLMPASGFQSMQFRMMEFAYGLRDEYFLKFFSAMPEGQSALKAIQERPSVYQEFVACFKAHAPKPTSNRPPLDLAGLDPSLNADFVNQLREVYENPGQNYHWVLLCEAVLDFDEKFAQWRNNHLLMVARTIGQKQGTGGSSGYDFLKSRQEYRFFPELWAIRTLIGAKYESGRK